MSEDKVSIKISDVYFIAKKLEKALLITDKDKRVFTKEEIKEIYPCWSSVMNFCGHIERKQAIEELYKEEEDVKIEEKKEK
jgi:hypothetical protein